MDRSCGRVRRQNRPDVLANPNLDTTVRNCSGSNTLSTCCSFQVGTSESDPGTRASDDTATTRSRPAATCGATVAISILGQVPDLGRLEHVRTA